MQTVNELKSRFKKEFLKKRDLEKVLSKKDAYVTNLQESIYQALQAGRYNVGSHAVGYVRTFNLKDQTTFWLARYLSHYALRKLAKTDGFRVDMSTLSVVWGYGERA